LHRSACSTKSIKKDTKRVGLGIKVDSYQAIDLNRSNNIGKNVYNFQSEDNINQNITQNDNIDNSDYSYLGGEFANNYLLMDFIDRMVVEYGFDKKYLNRIFSQAQYFYIIPKSKDCTSTIVKRGGAWDRYRDCFIYEDNIQRGLDFWEKYEDTLNRAEATYGVPVKYILAILGVETAYGVNFGKYRVIDVLTTKSMTGHRRSKFYTDELEKYLLITRDIGADPTELMGSTSGALGYGPFMPSSYMRFALISMEMEERPMGCRRCIGRYPVTTFGRNIGLGEA